MNNKFKIYAEELPVQTRKKGFRKWDERIAELSKQTAGGWYVIHEFDPERTTDPSSFMRSLYGDKIEFTKRRMGDVCKVYARVRTADTEGE